MAITPTQRSLNKLREEGYLCQIVEHWNPFARIRQDLFGFVDIVAVKANETIAIQTTARDSIQSRVKKIEEHKNYPLLKQAGWRIVCHGWGKLKTGWDCREIEL